MKADSMKPFDAEDWKQIAETYAALPLEQINRNASAYQETAGLAWFDEPARRDAVEAGYTNDEARLITLGAVRGVIALKHTLYEQEEKGGRTQKLLEKAKMRRLRIT